LIITKGDGASVEAYNMRGKMAIVVHLSKEDRKALAKYLEER